MQRKIDKNHVYNAGRCKADEELIHLHMCNHYRRILNAKKTVDNSPPYCYKKRRPVTCKPSFGKGKESRPFENLPLSDRSLSTNSNKESCWGAESFAGSSRYHARCAPQVAPHEPSIQHNFKDMDLVNRIAFDTKRGPSEYCDENWMGMKDENNSERYEGGFEEQQNPSGTKSSSNAKRRLPTTASQESAQKRKFAVQKKLKSSRLTAKGSKSFPSLDDKIYSKTFKTEAVSKLRSLRVYYPPRRKESRNKTESSSNVRIPHPLENSNCKCTKICVCDSSETVLKKIPRNVKEQSLTSSRDSAYNGGVSSLPESRSPTPDQRKKKECCCCCCEKKQQGGKIVFDPSKTIQCRVESPRAPAVPNSPPAPPSKSQQQESFLKMQEDAMYVKFIQDITTEILDKNLYTNKALKKVMKKHIRHNTRKLHKDRMLKEVENLRIQLGIPEDKTLLDVEGEGESGACDVSKFYPIISDSEFVLPKNKIVAIGKTDPTRIKASEKIPKSTRGGMPSDREDEETIAESETDEDEGKVISVIQVSKTVREKRKEKNEEVPTETGGRNSSDDSDRPSDPKKRSVLKNRKQKYARTYSSFSSDSESSGNISRKNQDRTAPKDGFLENFVQKTSYLGKKNRTVSFWKSTGHDSVRDFEKKHKERVPNGKNAILRDDGRGKPKND